MIMNLYNEIGGYFELEKDCGNHQFEGIPLNSGRNAMRYIIRAYSIKKIAVPYYTCPVIWDVLREEKVEIIFYHINKNLEIDLPYMPDNIFVLINNYFGIKGKYIKEMAKTYKNLIVDDAQSLYTSKTGLAHFNSPRKFFGLPDGGFAICDKILNKKLKQDFSYDRCSHLLIRADKGAEAGYSEFKKNDLSLTKAPFSYMSSLTYKMTSNIDYEGAKKKRLENFHFLHQALCNTNELNIDLDINDVPMVYPFLIKDNKLRSKLVENKIYIATYWPEIERICKKGFELYLQKYLFPLPIDQRYSLKDMQKILEVINEN